MYCPVPCQIDATPVLSISASAASLYVRVCFVFSDFCFSRHYYYFYFCPSTSAFPRISCVVVAPPAGHRNVGLVFWFRFRCFLLYFSFFLASRLVLSCRPSVGPSHGHIIRLIVPANSNLVRSGLGLRPARMYEVFCFIFLSFLFFSFSFFARIRPFSPFFLTVLSKSSFLGVHMYHGYVAGVISQHVIRDRVRQVVIVPLPLRTGTAARTIVFAFFHGDVFCGLFCDHGLDFRKMT